MKQTICILSVIFAVSFGTSAVKNIHVPVVVSDTPRLTPGSFVDTPTVRYITSDGGGPVIGEVRGRNLTSGIVYIIDTPRTPAYTFDQGLRPSYMPREAAIRDAMDTLRQLSFFIGRKLSDGQADRYRQSFMIAWNRLDSLTLK